ncbi:hypothetical protein [Phenylobacterium immobile]|uniref:hypothetical protein n=1 Tax=Phenylobacterium immobile TaxID=21 RepID=UPI000AB20C85|nr:hypothetical protein [Phenylobacterium immobile]
MLSQAIDQIILATGGLPAHIIVAQRFYGHDPQAVAALDRLRDALAELDRALLASRGATTRADRV